MAKNREYTEITRAAITSNRNVVISDCSKGGFTIAQQMEVSEGEKKIPVFLKGAFHVDDIHGLYNLRDSLNLAIKIIDERKNDEESWD